MRGRRAASQKPGTARNCCHPPPHSPPKKRCLESTFLIWREKRKAFSPEGALTAVLTLSPPPDRGGAIAAPVNQVGDRNACVPSGKARAGMHSSPSSNNFQTERVTAPEFTCRLGYSGIWLGFHSALLLIFQRVGVSKLSLGIRLSFLEFNSVNQELEKKSKLWPPSCIAGHPHTHICNQKTDLRRGAFSSMSSRVSKDDRWEMRRRLQREGKKSRC